MDKQELVKTLEEREQYLKGQWHRLADVADDMGGLDTLLESDSPDAKDLMEAFTATWKALNAVRRIINRNK